MKHTILTLMRNIRTKRARQNKYIFGAAILTALVFIAGVSTALAQWTPSTADTPTPLPDLHPNFPLLDADGNNVLTSGNPVSTMKTCGTCHDTAFIETHSFHANAGLNQFGSSPTGRTWDSSNGIFGKWSAIFYRYLTPSSAAVLDLGTPEWIQKFGFLHVGGGPALYSRSGTPLVNLIPDANSPETSILNPETGEKIAWNWIESGVVEMNCFLCHIANPDNDARIAMLESGNFGWANTATLAQTGAVNADGEKWAWNAAVFDDEDEINPTVLGIQDPANSNCGLCHGVVHTNLDEPLTEAQAGDLRTTITGQVFSPQKISNSGLNLDNKTTLDRSWDIHAERAVKCTQCHFSTNNPVYLLDNLDPEDHLIFDPRRLEIGAYLQRPIHQFARGSSAQASIDPNLNYTMRRCESCHNAEKAHTWLPYTEKHMEMVSCETCHIPELFAPAYQQIDWTVLQPGGQPVITHRGIEDPESQFPLISGYSPVLMQRTDVDGGLKLAPFNLVSAWFWVAGTAEQPVPVREIDLKAAWFVAGDTSTYAPEVIAAFDDNQNGILEKGELSITTEAKEKAISTRLAALGLQNPRILAETQPYSINHNISNGDWATRDCRVCHGENSRVTQPIVLAENIPGGVLPEFVQTGNFTPGGQIRQDENGMLIFEPNTQDQNLYVLGHSSVGWVDWLGILFFFGVIGGVFTHGGLRWNAARINAKKGKMETPALKTIYMYTVYERFWHWLQTGTILLLIFTGLVIHKPDVFGWFSFNGVVIVHNILAAILVINAALSLFYHLVSGEIKQYIPRPYGFFDQAIVQAKFYLQGIFSNEPHPFEKTPEKKLNPLQQITYFGILNILLPLQIITGALMWGAQRWPEATNSLGGLPFLGPFHSLVAWLFAAFIIAHVYLTTTGPYPLAGIKAMMLGYDEVETHHETETEHTEEHANSTKGA